MFNPKKRRIMDKQKPKGFNLPFASPEDYELGKTFIQSPETFLESIGLTFDDMTCPPEAHAAFKRGKDFRDAMAAKKFDNNKEYIAYARKLAVKYFGADFECAIIPFGVKFREKIDLEANPLDGTSTASGTITFLDGDVDSET